MMMQLCQPVIRGDPEAALINFQRFVELACSVKGRTVVEDRTDIVRRQLKSSLGDWQIKSRVFLLFRDQRELIDKGNSIIRIADKLVTSRAIFLDVHRLSHF